MQISIERAIKRAGVVSLAIMATMLTPERSNAADTAVKVYNTAASPVLTQATDNPALQFFENTYRVDIASGASAGSLSAFAVPAGKRLVIQTVSVYRAGAFAGQSSQVFVVANQSPADISLALPLVPDSGVLFPGATLSAVFYVDQKIPVVINAYRTGTTNAETDFVAISGYFVTVPPS